MNTHWFKQQLADRKLSQRQLARLLHLDHAAVSLMLRGKRKMTLKEAHSLAEILSLPVSHVLREAGLDVRDDVRVVPIAGYCNQDCLVVMMALGTHDKVPVPADVPADAYAVQVRAPATVRDGSLYIVSPAHKPPAECLDLLCFCALNDGRYMMAYIKRGYKRELYNLIIPIGDRPIQDVQLAWASPVLWVKP